MANADAINEQKLAILKLHHDGFNKIERVNINGFTYCDPVLVGNK